MSDLRQDDPVNGRTDEARAVADPSAREDPGADAFRARITKARLTLLNEWPFLGHLVLALRPRLARPEDRVPTAAVGPDGTVAVDADYLDTLTDAELCGLLAHEALHPALLCFERQGDRGVQVEIDCFGVACLWNLAHDLSFNAAIQDVSNERLRLPPGAALCAGFRGMSAEEIYDLLFVEVTATPSTIEGAAGRLSGTYGVGDDLRRDLTTTPDGEAAARGDASAARKLVDEWRITLATAAQAHEGACRGSLPEALQRLVDAILEPRLDWREELSRWLGENGRPGDYSFRRPGRRSAGVGTYLPSFVRSGLPDVTVLVDTSGSVGPERLGEALAELQGICDDLACAVRVLVVDADVHDDLPIEDARELAERLVGGGGSDFTPAFERLLEEGYEGVVVAFTDGEITVPETTPTGLRGTLWVLREGDQDPTGGRWGEVLRLPAEPARAR